MMASPLWTVCEVLKTKSAASMPISTSAAMLANGVIWTMYGFQLGDIYIGSPNAIGSFLAFLQVGLWLRFELLQHTSKIGDYFFVGSFSDIDYDDEMDLIREEDNDTVLSFDSPFRPYFVPLRPHDCASYSKSFAENYEREAAEMLSPRSDISDLTWGTGAKSRFERIMNAFSPLSSPKAISNPVKHPFYGATL